LFWLARQRIGARKIAAALFQGGFLRTIGSK